MKILIVASYNKGYYAPFIVEQAEALKRAGCEVEFFGVVGKGIKGYIKALPELKKSIADIHPDLIHAHYGLSGLFANLQREVPVVTTYHGSDINEKAVLPFSRMAMRLSKFNIFVSKRTMEIGRPRKNYALVPCGIDLSDLQLTGKAEAREKMRLKQNGRYILFAGAFDNPVKNYPLAKEAMAEVPDAELLELKGYTRDQVTLLMCAADALLVTSFTEGSPQVVKEAMACGCPIVSVDVGNVREVTDGVEGCYICSRDPEEIAGSIKMAQSLTEKIKGREAVISMGLTNEEVARKITDIYRNII